MRAEVGRQSAGAPDLEQRAVAYRQSAARLEQTIAEYRGVAVDSHAIQREAAAANKDPAAVCSSRIAGDAIGGSVGNRNRSGLGIGDAASVDRRISLANSRAAYWNVG